MMTNKMRNIYPAFEILEMTIILEEEIINFTQKFELYRGLPDNLEKFS